MVERQFCAQLARDTADPFIGTATRADSWLLIEYTAVWERSEIESSHLPSQVKDWIEEIKHYATQTRFIKRPGRKSGDITVFFVITLEQRQAIYRFQFARYEDILTLDLAALRTGAQQYEPYRYQAPLFLVCTHGKHDACCAKFGMPVYHEFERLAGEHTWQSSHVGGDKFAANVICFPYGIYYGRVAVSEVGEIIAACNASQLYLKRFRGRSCYLPIVQAADYLLRVQTEQTDLGAFRLLSVQQAQDGQSWVCFENVWSGTQHCLLLQEHISEKTAYRTTCHPEGKKILSGRTSCGTTKCLSLDTFGTTSSSTRDSRGLFFSSQCRILMAEIVLWRLPDGSAFIMSEDWMRAHYNRIAGQNLERLAALSDGVFAIAMTLLVLDLRVPASEVLKAAQSVGQSEVEKVVRDTLMTLAPNFLVYFMSFLTLGIFWVGQQTQLNHFVHSDRHLTWIHLFFLLDVSLIPFSTGLLAAFLTSRIALVVYWFNICLLGVALYGSIRYAKRAKLMTDETVLEMHSAHERRIISAQAFYAFGTLLCVINNYWSIAIIVFVQLNYVIAPRIRGLDRLFG